MPQLTIVILQYRPDAGALRRTLAALAMQDTRDFAVVLGDDGSPQDYFAESRAYLAAHGITCTGHAARQLTRADYDRYDLLIGMDSANIRNMMRICGGDPEGKIHRLLDYTARPGDVADPWYTGDFSATWRDVLEGCTAILHRYTACK